MCGHVDGGENGYESSEEKDEKARQRQSGGTGVGGGGFWASAHVDEDVGVHVGGVDCTGRWVSCSQAWASSTHHGLHQHSMANQKRDSKQTTRVAATTRQKR